MNVEDARQEGQRLGVYDPEVGTERDAQGYVWEQHGLQVERQRFDNPDDAFNNMAQDLDDGKGVVVGVDTSPIWNQEGGHALWVTGMETNADREVTSVICNDTGRDDGQQVSYPTEQFEEAWRATDYQMVSTRERLYS